MSVKPLPDDHPTWPRHAKTGLLLVNLGTPDATDKTSMRRYLKQFLSDKRVIEIPRLLWWLILHAFILTTRPKKSAEAYAEVWTDRGSPLLYHLEDQVAQKRCGHRPNKAIVSQQEMVDRIKAAADAKLDPDFYLIARTDAFQKEGLDAAIERANACVEAGADAIFAEAVHTLDDYQAFCQRVNAPILANITEFGATPLFSQQELGDVGCRMVLYPLSAFRAMNAAALKVYQSIMTHGHQREVIDIMQTRDELYDFLNYHDFEQKLDALFAEQKDA
mgnify:CR=1 FL=1